MQCFVCVSVRGDNTLRVRVCARLGGLVEDLVDFRISSCIIQLHIV